MPATKVQQATSTGAAPALNGVVQGNFVYLFSHAFRGASVTAETAATDSNGTVTTQDRLAVASGPDGILAAAYYVPNANAGTHTFTCQNFGAGAQERAVFEFSGVEKSANPLDVKTSNSTTVAGATSVTTGTTGATGQADELILVGATLGGSPGVLNVGWTDPISGFTSLAKFSNDSTDIAGLTNFKNVAATGTQTATFNWTDNTATPQGAIALIGTYRNATGGAAIGNVRIANPNVGPIAKRVALRLRGFRQMYDTTTQGQASTAGADLSSAGAAAATLATQSLASANLSSTAAASAVFASASSATANLSSAGAASMVLATNILAKADLSSAGAASAVFASQSSASANLSMAGSAAVTLASAATASANLAMAGAATGTLASAALASVALSMAGTATAIFEASALSSGQADISIAGSASAVFGARAVASADIAAAGASTVVLEASSVGIASADFAAAGSASAVFGATSTGGAVVETPATPSQAVGGPGGGGRSKRRKRHDEELALLAVAMGQVFEKMVRGELIEAQEIDLRRRLH